MPHRERINIRPGLKVAIVLKQDQRTGNETAAEHAIELGDPDGQAGCRLHPEVGECHGIGPARRRAARLPGRARRLTDDGLDERVPGGTGAALSLPAKERLAARLTDVPALKARHGSDGPADAAGCLPGGGGSARRFGADCDPDRRAEPPPTRRIIRE